MESLTAVQIYPQFSTHGEYLVSYQFIRYALTVNQDQLLLLTLLKNTVLRVTLAYIAGEDGALFAFSLMTCYIIMQRNKSLTESFSMSTAIVANSSAIIITLSTEGHW